MLEGIQVEGTFNVERFYQTLALILSEREKVKITVSVLPAVCTEDGEGEGKKEAG